MQQDRRPVRLIATGDLQLGDSSTAVGFGFRSRYGDVTSLRRWSGRVRSVLGSGDIVFGNLECVLSEFGARRNDWRSFQMRGLPSYADAIAAAGFTLVNVANNHGMQHGQRAFEESVERVMASGLRVVGLRGAAPWCSQPVIIESHRRVGVIGYSLRPRQYGHDQPLYAEGNADSILVDVRRLKTQVDDVIVSLHWGEEFVAAPSQGEVETAMNILSAGASAIIGHHPHVLRPLHQINGGVVAYSLGNFSGDMVWYEPHRTGGILRCDLASSVAHATLEKVRIEDDYLPISTGDVVAASPSVTAMAASQYADTINATLRAQRFAAYRYALRNLHRFRLRMMSQLAVATAINKVRGLVDRLLGRAVTA